MKREPEAASENSSLAEQSPRLADCRVDDSMVVQALEEYRSAVAAGRKPSRAELIARYPQIAGDLSACLDAVEFIQEASRQLPVESVDALIADAELQSSRPLGDFRIVREIGRGGMGVVYEAEQLSLGRRVALKVLPFASALDPKQLQRFKNEAQAAANLRHPHIVAVYAVGAERGVHYYAMEYIEGQTLAALIRQLRSAAGLEPRDERFSASALAVPSTVPPTRPEQLPLEHAAAPATAREQPERERETVAELFAELTTERSLHRANLFRTVARWGIQAGQALEHAHQLGVIHRDIKPANLLVDARGELWITDFGLAQISDNTRITMTGDLLGTLRYMSPEQALGNQAVADPRSDIYSLGVTLYELLTLEPAFPGKDRQEVLRGIAFEEPKAARRIHPAIPVELETIVDKAMAKSPEDRYATAGELADDLRRWLNDEPIRAKRAGLGQKARRWARRHKAAVWSVGVSLVLLLAGSVLGLAINNAWIARERENVRRERDAAEAARKEAVVNLETARRAVDQMLTRVSEERLAYVPQMEQVRRDILEDAVRFYEGLLETKSDDPQLLREAATAYRRLGGQYRRLGQREQAEQALRNSLALMDQFAVEGEPTGDDDAERVRTYTNLGWLLGQAGRRQEEEVAHRKAHAIAEEVVSRFPGESTYESLLAGTCINVANSIRPKQHEEAERLYRRAIELARDNNRLEHGRAWMALGELQVLTGRRAEAEDAFRRASRLFEELLADVPELWQARERLFDSRRRLADLLLQLGRPAESVEALERAAEAIEKLEADYPSVPYNRDGKAIAYAKLVLGLSLLGKLDEAEVLYDKLGAMEPAGPDACNTVAWLLVSSPEPRFRDVPRAVELARRASEGEPAVSANWTTLGGALYRSGDVDAAFAALEKAIALSRGSDAAACLFLAMAHGEQGERENAREWYDRAVQWIAEKQSEDVHLRHLVAEAAQQLGLEGETNR